MSRLFVTELNEKSIPIIPVIETGFDDWLPKQTTSHRSQITSNRFEAKSGSYCLMFNQQGDLEQVLLGLKSKQDFWPFGALAKSLPKGVYFIDHNASSGYLTRACQAWALGYYRFDRYKESIKATYDCQLVIPEACDINDIISITDSVNLVRDLINTPADDMGPAELAEAAEELSKHYHAEFKQIIGEDLLLQNYPMVYNVGRASIHPPRLLDIRWGKKNHPKLTLVGKGVCFDSGGLDIKPAAGMLTMKKDMGGAAHVLGLAKMIMSNNIPVRLRVLIPAVENAVSGNAYHPGDILPTRKGITVEIGNTDAEGRLVLADALAEAASEKPDLLIDIATLTGAARIAVGPDISAMFTPDDDIANHLHSIGMEISDVVWRQPLYSDYLTMLDSPIADINNAAANGYGGGAITAALFLQQFVGEDITQWVHFDIMASNVTDKPGRPLGAEAMSIRTLFHYIKNRFPGG